MWTTVLALAIAVNFEPNRLAIIALLIIRPHPICNLALFLLITVLVSGISGLLVLLLVDRTVVGRMPVNPGVIQIALGVFALATSAILVRAANRPVDASKPRLIDTLTAKGRQVLNGNSPWLSGALGVAIALPSADYLALVLLIASSGVSFATQVMTLLTFLAVANIVLLAPLGSYLFARDRTQWALVRLREWVLRRGRRDYAALLALAGLLLITMGVARL